MNTLSKLRNCNSIDDLVSSFSLNISNQKFSYILYVLPDDKKYKRFTIPKSDGTERNIFCPEDTLKFLQKEFNKILSNCISEIQQVNPFYLYNNHAFERYKSIASNAFQHEKQRYILNIDIKDFFSSIHYGRIIGILQKDKYLSLPENCAKIIAKLATYNGYLPQGSPLSPVLSSLIGNIIDSRLLKLAKKYKLKYTRYADDITFSSNRDFSDDLLIKENNLFVANKRLISAIENTGFTINHKKTRYTDCFHRQVVTGIVVNKFINTNREYKKKTRFMVYNLFQKGTFKIKGKDNIERDGSIKQLIGRLNHSISIKYRDRILNSKLSSETRNEINKKLTENLTNIIQYRGGSHYLHKHIGIEKIESSFSISKDEARSLLSFIQKNDDKSIIPDDSIKLLRNVLFYKYFVHSDKPIIITEGKTDVAYFKAAIKELSIKDNLKIIQQKRNGELNKLGLTGGTDPIKKFIDNSYSDNKYVDFSNLKVEAKAPVIFILDYDEGLDKLNKILESNFLEGNRFSQIKNNIYILLLREYKKIDSRKPSFQVKENQVCIENLIYFNNEKIEVIDDKVRYQGKSLSKNEFSQYVIKNSNIFDFSKFQELFIEIKNIIDHFNGIP